MTTKDFNVKGFCERLNRARRRRRISVCELRGRPIDACTKERPSGARCLLAGRRKMHITRGGYLMSVFGEVEHVYVSFLIAHAP